MYLESLQVKKEQAGFWALVVRVFISTILMAVLLVYVTPAMDFWVSAAWFERVVPMLGIVLGGVSLYVVCLVLLGLRMGDIRSPVRS